MKKTRHSEPRREACCVVSRFERARLFGASLLPGSSKISFGYSFAAITIVLWGIFTATVGAQIPNTPAQRAGFPKVLAGSGSIVVTQPAVGDLDNDGVKEIVVGTKGRKLYVINAGGTILAGWPVTLPAEVVGCPAIGDIDGDGFADVVVSFKGTTDPTGSGGVRAYTRTAGLIWSVTTGDANADGLPDGVYSSPAIGDVDGDGRNDVVFGSFDFNVYVITRDGTALAGWPKFLRDTTFSSPALADLKGDGKLEIIIGCDTHAEGPPFNTPDGGGLHVFLPNGQEMPGFPRFVNQTIMSSPAVGDIDGDGRPDIVVGGGTFYTTPGVGKQVYAFRCDGTNLPGWPVNVADQVFNSPALGDLDKDGKLDVVIADNSANIYAFRFNGTQIFTSIKPKDFFGNSFNASNPIVADVDGDGNLDILVATNTEIAVISSTGVQITDDGTHQPGKISYFTQTTTSGAVVTNLDNNGSLYVIIGSGTPFPSAANGEVYAYLAGSATAATPWPAFHQNPATRRGVIPGTPTCAPVPQQFFTLTPCRVVDTRNPNGPLGGPAIPAFQQREFILIGNCGIPVTAKTVAMNVTVTGFARSDSFGDARVFPSGTSWAGNSTINWSNGRTRANNAIVPLGIANGGVYVWIVTPTDSVHVIIDVVGYFQ
ncbi:MAG TPA: VCBS repeat-containing protein [Acidobacteriota bacterium]|jgi:hypothetical protein